MASGRPGSSSGGPGRRVGRVDGDAVTAGRHGYARDRRRRAAARAAPAPMTASSWSSSADEAPLTPTAPIDLAVVHDRHPALQRDRPREVQGRRAPAGRLVLEVLARPAVDRRRAGLVGGDLDARDLGGVGAHEEDELAAGVDAETTGATPRSRGGGADGLGRHARALVGQGGDLGGRERRRRRRRSRSPRPRRASRRWCRPRRRPRRRPSAGCRRSGTRRRAARARRGGRPRPAPPSRGSGRTKIAAVRALSTATRALATWAPWVRRIATTSPEGSTTQMYTRAPWRRRPPRRPR